MMMMMTTAAIRSTRMRTAKLGIGAIVGVEEELAVVLAAAMAVAVAAAAVAGAAAASGQMGTVLWKRASTCAVACLPRR